MSYKRFTANDFFCCIDGNSLTFAFQINKDFEGIGPDAESQPAVFVNYCYNMDTNVAAIRYHFDGNDSSFEDYRTLVAAMVGAGVRDYAFPIDEGTKLMIDYWKESEEEAVQYIDALYPIIKKVRSEVTPAGALIKRLEGRREELSRIKYGNIFHD